MAHLLALVMFACLAALWPISAAQAACISPQTATISSGGTATFTCADFGFISPANISPSHGSLTFGMPSNTSALIYTNNGDGATSDTFIVKDDFATPITFNITINPSTSPLTVTPSSVATPVIGTSYNQALSTSGGTGPYSYSLVAGSNLPPGLSLSSSGVISGTPTGSGPYNFTVRVVDSTTPTANTLDKAYSVLIAPPAIDVTPDTPPHGGVGTAYSVQFSASGGTPGYTYTRDSGSLPAGLTLSASGLLSGTPSAVGSSTFNLKVQDSTTISTGGVHFITQNVTVTVNAFPPVSLTPAGGTALSAGVVGTSYSNASISASGGSGTITYAVTAGALPAGLGINGSTGAITGTPTVGAIGTANFTVTATAATSGSASASYSITVSAPPVVLTPASGALTGGTVGVSYSNTSISASGGVGTITYAITAGSLPAGLSMSTSTGAISGTPTAGGFGTANFTVMATAATTGSASASYSIAIVAPPVVLTPASGALAGGTVGAIYPGASISASGGLGTISYAVTSGVLPAGLALNPSTGAISGTPTAGGFGTFNFTVTATGATAGSASASYSITVAATPVVLTPSDGTTLTAGTVGSAYSDASISATGGAGPISYSVTAGALPAGLTLNASTGAINGTPTAGGFGTANFEVTATAATNGSATANYTIVIGAQPVVLTPATGTALTAGTVGSAYSQTISASGGVGAFTYVVSSGAVPDGLSLNATTGTISGTPTAGAFGTANFTVTATAATSGSASATYSIEVGAPPLVMTPANGTALSAGTVGASYPGASISATGGLGSLSFSVTSGALPDGLTIDPASGAITGTPTAPALGTSTFTVTAIAATSGTASASYTITVVAPPVVLTPAAGATLTGGMVGSSYSETSISASGGVGAFSYTVTTGALPAGLAIDLATGAISGTPTATGFGTANFTVTATAATAGSASANYTIVVGAPPVVLTPASGTALSAGTVGSSYSDTSVSASGGAGAIGFAVTAGSLPPGLTLNASTGAITGTPTDAALGQASFTLTATAATSGTASASYTIVVGAPAVVLMPASGAALSGGTVGISYSETAISASGGVGTFTYAVTAGSLPAGLSIDTATGAIAGTPTVAALGTANFSVTATAATSGSAAANYSITIAAPPVVLTPASGALVAGIVGSTYSDTSISASGGVGTISYAVTAGTLPAGLTIDATTGAITGTPTAAALGTANFTVTATAATAGSASTGYTITVGAPPVVLTPATGTALSGGTVGSSYSDTSISASGGVGTFSYAVTSGALPAGLALDAATGAISGTPTAAGFGTTSFTVTATAATSGSASANYSIAIGAPALVLTPATGTALSAGTAGSSYSDMSISASGGVGTISYTVTAGSLPAGLSLNASSGAISGTPTAGALGTATFTVTATAAVTGSVSASYSIAIWAPTLVLTPATGTVLSAGTVGVAYSDTSISASGGVGTISYAVTTGSLPVGLSLNASNGAISGTPTVGAIGTANFTVTATAATSGSANASYSITVAAVPVVLTPATGATLSSGTLGVNYSDTSISASGGVGGFTYAVTSGALPGGLMLDESSGRISGKPSADGDFRFTVTATDASGATGQANYSLSILPSNFVFSPSAGALPDAMVGEAYSSRISATGGVGALVYSVKSGDLPKGMVLNVSTGELTGPLASDATPDTYRFTIAVTDSRGASGSATYTLKLNGRSVTAPDFVIDVPAGSAPNNVYLNSGATGGPFINAAIASVEPPIAGKAEIVEGELAAAGSFTPVGYYLKFTPNPSYSGSAVVGYTLHSAFGSSNVGHVTYRIALDRVAVGEEIDGLVRDFVRTRQNLLSSTVQVPGLLDRRRAAASTDPVTTAVTPTDKGARLGFSSSLAQIQAARDAADAAAAGQTFVKTDQLFDIWVNGSFLFHKDEDDKSDKWGNFALFSVGADYLINDRALVGLSFHYDYMTDPTAEDAELTGNGWLAGPYASFEIGQGVFLDANLLYGGSSNDIDTGIFGGSFDTSRWMADVKLTGEWQLDELTVLTPKLRAVYFNEKTDDYTVKNAIGETIDLKGFIEEQARFSVGFDVERTLELENGLTLSPTVGADVGFASLDGEGLFGRVEAGLALSNNDNWDLDFSLLFNIEGDGSQSAGAKIGARVSF
ncbi:hypothetical protein GFB56_11435 [Ensifer sp. T173]|uniref:Autotransporter domain-containing protein n=1 Tax=Ensifer canadensis TaxID=555315 RepID=A0AAW4FH39_9HYPH|nr:putative Ig domain-containing protein [Ensifer canadensis]MBM3091427.1 hypothetical protein [Ensifer canadensis]UBI78935.1 putative Ig domain-containing protein [Ensifer canadensis]